MRVQCFTLLNVAGLAAMCWLSGANGVRVKDALSYSKVPFIFFSIYVALVLANYGVLRRCQRDHTISAGAAFLLPIAFLAYIKYASDLLNPLPRFWLR